MSYPTLEQAELARSNLNNHEFQGTNIKTKPVKVHTDIHPFLRYSTIKTNTIRLSLNFVYTVDMIIVAKASAKIFSLIQKSPVLASIEIPFIHSNSKQ